MAGALAGCRVVELARGIAGPYAALLLAEQGAEVLKLEPPGGSPDRADPAFHVLNRSKQAGALDPARPAGHASLLDLLAGTDVLVYDGSPAAQARLGLDYAALSAVNPRLVYLWLPPFGSHGPQRERAADDALVAAYGGIAATQYSGEPRPTYITMPLSSYGAAILAAGAACAALRVVERCGQGQLVEVSWLAGAIALQTGGLLRGGVAIRRMAGISLDPLGPLPIYHIYRGADGRYLFLACGHHGFFIRLCTLVDRLDLLADPRFEGAPWGLVEPEARAALLAELTPIFATKPRDEWLALLESADIPCAPVATRDDYLTDPQVVHNGLRVELRDPLLGATVQPGIPVALHGTPGEIRGPAPRPPATPPSFPPRSPRPAGSTASLPASPLAGVRVLDLTGFIAGSLCPGMLADWGADVIKVEGPDGDPFRAIGFGFLGWNRGKRGIVIDLKRPEGRELFYDLVREADVVAENFRPGVAARLGVDYPTLQAINPRLVYSTETGYGSSGPYMAKPGFDPLAQARSGAMAAQGGLEAGHPPVFLTVALSDYSAALLSAFGVAAALVTVERTGVGQRLDTTLVGSAMATQWCEFLRYPGSRPPLQGGPAFPGPSALRRLYQTSDGWLQLAIGEPEQWPALAKVLGHPELQRMFAAKGALIEPNDGTLARVLADAFATLSTAGWLEALDVAGVPAAPVLDGPAIFADPHVLANELFTENEHPLWGDVTQHGQLVKFGRTPGVLGPAAPLLGQHTVAVLREAGIAAARIESLLAQGVIRQDSPG